jgi:potassium-transporting ATPase potassium-binding subunit
VTSFLVQALLFVAVVVALTKPVGVYLARVFAGESTWLDPVFRPIERAAYRVAAVDPDCEMPWTVYLWSLLAFNAVGMVVLFVILRLQGVLPLNPMHNPSQGFFLALNTAASFVTNTNWQAYSGETAATYLSQMMGLTWQNFVSAATGIAAGVALIRGLSRESASTIGNFWVDLVRAVLWVLLPAAFVVALVFASQGVVANLGPATRAVTLEGRSQLIAQGPVASQESIKHLGTNGGGFFNANSAHPYENPSPLSDFIQMVLIFVIPAGLTYMFGRYVKDQRQGWAIFAAMLVLFVGAVVSMYAAEQAGNPILARLGANQAITAAQPGGSTEGKEVRFGIAASSIFGSATTAASNGAVNMMHDSATPLGGAVAMLLIALGEIAFGGVGVGLMGMLLFALLAVFIAGLMVGRTPEYLGKKIESAEIKIAVVAILVIAAATKIPSAIACCVRAGLAGILNHGPHGLSEILYAYTSAVGNNGSAFAGLAANTPFYNLTTALSMLVGRFAFIGLVLAIAGSLAKKKILPTSSGTFPTTGWLFVALLVGTVIIVGALTYFPVYALGPILEHFLMHSGVTF